MGRATVNPRALSTQLSIHLETESTRERRFGLLAARKADRFRAAGSARAAGSTRAAGSARVVRTSPISRPSSPIAVATSTLKTPEEKSLMHARCCFWGIPLAVSPSPFVLLCPMNGVACGSTRRKATLGRRDVGRRRWRRRRGGAHGGVRGGGARAMDQSCARRLTVSAWHHTAFPCALHAGDAGQRCTRGSRRQPRATPRSFGRLRRRLTVSGAP